ncbi:MAG: hypothetical protein KatS3mg129_2347 [Leptospiraceae bacterium]|nr:MAG: hypothetical protein KatS3mg129_2347 [Leptospiraceae bacterium]
MKLKPLTEYELRKPYSKYYYMPLVKIPEIILNKLERPILPKKAILFEEKNRFLIPDNDKEEIGYCIFPDGSGYIAMRIEMPDVTPEMIEWWFYWHSLESLRYKIWYPGAHYKISVKNKKILYDKNLPPKKKYIHNTHYITEDVGKGKMNLFISFYEPEEFGFDINFFKKANISTIICGIVGFRNLHLKHTYLFHIVHNYKTGVILRSRFYVGHDIQFILNNKSICKVFNKKIFRRIIITEKLLKGLSLHCAQEFLQLSKILPELYFQYKNFV